MKAQILKALAMSILALAIPALYVVAVGNFSDPWGMLIGCAGIILGLYALAKYMERCDRRKDEGGRDD